MSKQKFIEAMGHVDDRILERYMKEEDRLASHKKKWPGLIVAAACLALVATVVSLLMPPYYKTSPYSAQQIADLFPADKGVSTNAYSKVYVPNAQYLYLNDLPEQEYLPVYTYDPYTADIDLSAFKDYLNSISDRLTDALGAEIPPFEINEGSEISGKRDTLRAEAESEQYLFSASQSNNSYTFYIRKNFGLSPEIVLNGETVQIDQRQTDEQIIASLSGIKQSLFDIFGVSFINTKVVRYYDDYNKYGANRVYIYFYNEDDHPLNQIYESVSDYICLSFDNIQNWQGDYISDSILCDVDIHCRKTRTDSRDQYKETAQVKRLSLEEAEALLCKGYVFGGHSCRRCMAAQDKVDFEDYDYVGFTYVIGQDHETYYPTVAIPFYVFYKQIGTTKDGIVIYAQTYVPAIEVSGLEEYFEGQQAKHPS